MNEPVIDVLVQAGLSADQARSTVALYTMAQMLADLRAQHLAAQPPEPADEGGDAP